MHSNDPPTCLEARERALAYRAQEHHQSALLTLALRGLLVELDGAFGNPSIELTAHHISTCKSCQMWLDELDPVWAAGRDRQAKYCCSYMFLAVNPDSEHDTVRFALSVDRDGCPCWAIDGKEAFARFCPWCASPLPEDGFE